MFEILSEASNRDHKRTYVRLSDGKAYCIDTADTFDCGPETMVFRYDPKNDKVDYRRGLYVAHYQTMEDAFKGHDETVAGIESILGGDKRIQI